jgi:outer membrane protein OmpA-like peptidoglycan-associated protein
MNVAIDKQLDKNATTSFNSISFGYTIQPSLTYQLSYQTSFLLGMYFNQQFFQNKDVTSYRLTDKVGEYNSMTNGVKTSVATSWGVNVGLRIFFGEKPDRDGDNVTDADDRCPLAWGYRNTKGCPDRDDDGIIDDLDSCKDQPGPAYTHGCPDRDGDGVADKDDKCPDVAGELNGCPIETIAAKYGYTKGTKTVVTDPLENYFDILKVSVINFNSSKSNLLDTSIIALNEAVDAMKQDTKTIIYVSGHADSIGNYATNMRLSFARAKVVKDYLVSHGIDANRILTAGYGKEEPLVDNKTPMNRAINRRTELKLLLPLKKKD